MIEIEDNEYEAIERNNRLIHETENKLNAAYYTTFKSPHGQIVLQDLLNLYYRGTSFPEDMDPYKVMSNEGKRLVIIGILSRMEVVSKKPED